MVGGSNGYRAALARRQLTPGQISSSPETVGLRLFISFSTSYAELDSAVRRPTTWMASVRNAAKWTQLARATLNRYLSILKRLIFESSVRAGSPSIVAAPDGGRFHRRRRGDCGPPGSICCRTWLISSRLNQRNVLHHVLESKNSSSDYPKPPEVRGPAPLLRHRPAQRCRSGSRRSRPVAAHDGC